MLISLRITLTNCGSSSMEKLRSTCPIRVTLGSSLTLKRGPSASLRCRMSSSRASASTTMVRSLMRRNGLPSRPTRIWRKSGAGRPESDSECTHCHHRRGEYQDADRQDQIETALCRGTPSESLDCLDVHDRKSPERANEHAARRDVEETRRQLHVNPCVCEFAHQSIRAEHSDCSGRYHDTGGARIAHNLEHASRRDRRVAAQRLVRPPQRRARSRPPRT